jgi:hypothetical protein
MHRKIISIVIITLLILTSLSMLVSAGLENTSDPIITDEEGDAFGYLDILEINFFEKETEPNYLFVTMSIAEPSNFKFQQTFAVFWKYKNIQYSCGFGIGFGIGEKWKIFDAGQYDNQAPYGGPGIYEVYGEYDIGSGIISWKIPKDIIGDPNPNDILTNTYGNAFRRLGFIGRLGFSRPLLNFVILMIFDNKLWDGAPDGAPYEFGMDYIIKY